MIECFIIIVVDAKTWKWLCIEGKIFSDDVLQRSLSGLIGEIVQTVADDVEQRWFYGKVQQLGNWMWGIDQLDAAVYKYCQEKCRTQSPELQNVGGGHLVACQYPLAQAKGILRWVWT